MDRSRPFNEHLTVLLVEDDPGDALLVQEMLADAGEAAELRWVHDVASSVRALADRTIACVLLDLGLPDAAEDETLNMLLAAAAGRPVIVLTGRHDRAAGLAAVASGAADFLGKSEIDGPLLAKSIRYAVERRRAEENARRLFEAELRQGREPQGRAEPPAEAVAHRHVHPGCETRYRPGSHYRAIGGDFFDAIERDDGSIRLIVGDVCGHGPDEAALGVSLRIAWRTSILAGLTDSQTLPTLQRLLLAEHGDDIFVTACDLTVASDRRRVEYRLAGHWPPVLLGPGGKPIEALPSAHRGMPLGLEDSDWPTGSTVLPEGWSLLVYTDGIVEGRDGPDGERLGLEGLVELLATQAPEDWRLDDLLSEVERRNGGPLDDDVAVVLLGTDPLAGTAPG